MTCGVANYTLLYSKQLSNITKIYTGQIMFMTWCRECQYGTKA